MNKNTFIFNNRLKIMFRIFFFAIIIFNLSKGEAIEELRWIDIEARQNPTTTRVPQPTTSLPLQCLQWHKTQTSKLKNIYQVAQQIKERKFRDRGITDRRALAPNVATFQISVNVSGQTFPFDYDHILALSGGDVALRDQLHHQSAFSSYRLQCIADYCPPENGKPSDRPLRQTIKDFFEFQETLSESQKDTLKERYRDTLEKCEKSAQSLFEDFTLTQKSIEKLAQVYTSTLDARLFTVESKERAKKLNLIHKKTKKMGENVDLDDLFDDTFQLNFSDSEQTIRLFINKLGAEPSNPWTLPPELQEFFNPLLSDPYLEEDCKEFESLEKKIKKEKDSSAKRILEQQLEEKRANINEQIKLYEELRQIRIELDIASYYDMCRNCQATLHYDISTRRHLQKNIFLKMIKSLMPRERNVRRYLIASLSQENANETGLLSTSQVFVNISSLIPYEPSEGEEDE